MQFDDPTITQTLAAMREENKPAATPERLAYKAALADSVQDWQESQAEQRRPIEEAVSSFTAETAGKTLYEAALAERPARADDETELGENAGQDDGGFSAACKALDLDEKSLREKGLSTHSDLRSMAANVLPRLSAAVSPKELQAVLTSNEVNGKDIVMRMVAEIDRARSPKYGRDGDRTPEQQMATETLAAETLKQMIATHKLGGKQTSVEAHVRRSMLLDDHENFRPGAASQSANRLPSRGYPNIHALYAANPTGR